MANLAIGVLADLRYWFCDEFWRATVTGYAGAGAGRRGGSGRPHTIYVGKTGAKSNAGLALWADIAFPIILIALLVIAWRPCSAASGPPQSPAPAILTG